jgi:hypothetical protein
MKRIGVYFENGQQIIREFVLNPPGEEQQGPRSFCMYRDSQFYPYQQYQLTADNKQWVCTVLDMLAVDEPALIDNKSPLKWFTIRFGQRRHDFFPLSEEELDKLVQQQLIEKPELICERLKAQYKIANDMPEEVIPVPSDLDNAQNPNEPWDELLEKYNNQAVQAEIAQRLAQVNNLDDFLRLLDEPYGKLVYLHPDARKLSEKLPNFYPFTLFEYAMYDLSVKQYCDLFQYEHIMKDGGFTRAIHRLTSYPDNKIIESLGNQLIRDAKFVNYIESRRDFGFLFTRFTAVQIDAFLQRQDVLAKIDEFSQKITSVMAAINTRDDNLPEVYCQKMVQHVSPAAMAKVEALFAAKNDIIDFVYKEVAAQFSEDKDNLWIHHADDFRDMFQVAFFLDFLPKEHWARLMDIPGMSDAWKNFLSHTKYENDHNTVYIFHSYLHDKTIDFLSMPQVRRYEAQILGANPFLALRFLKDNMKAYLALPNMSHSLRQAILATRVSGTSTIKAYTLCLPHIGEDVSSLHGFPELNIVELFSCQAMKDNLSVLFANACEFGMWLGWQKPQIRWSLVADNDAVAALVAQFAVKDNPENIFSQLDFKDASREQRQKLFDALSKVYGDADLVARSSSQYRYGTLYAPASQNRVFFDNLFHSLELEKAPALTMD